MLGGFFQLFVPFAQRGKAVHLGAMCEGALSRRRGPAIP
jgi:hypothetical protein